MGHLDWLVSFSSLPLPNREYFCGLRGVLLKSRFEIHCRENCSYKCKMELGDMD